MSHTNKVGRIEANYVSTSIWYFKDSDDGFCDDPLPFNIEDVHNWYIKWDSLNVQHTPDSEWVEYEPNISAEDDHDYIKRPEQVFLDELEDCDYHLTLRTKEVEKGGLNVTSQE